jgi:hypothetical protein
MASVALYELIRRLRSGLSRNRNFELFQQPTARRALRVHLMLRQLEKDLLRHADGASIRVQTADAGPQEGPLILEIVVPALKLRRRVHLRRQELELLCQNPEIARILGEHGNPS